MTAQISGFITIHLLVLLIINYESASYPFIHSGLNFRSALKVSFTSIWCLPFKVLGNRFVARSVLNASFNTLNPGCFRLVLTAPCGSVLCMSHRNNPPYPLPRGAEVPGT